MIDEANSEKFTRQIFGCDPEDISETVVLTYKRQLIKELKKKVEVLKEFRGFYEGFTGRYDGRAISAVKILVGSPVASDATYFLRFTPCKNIIYTGSVGALQEDIKIGDIIVPTGAVRGEGASKYHVEEWYPAVPSFELLRKAAPDLETAFSKLNVKVHYGVIYTTDSFAAETKEFLQKLQKMHIIGIEMETSSIFTIANLQSMNVMAIHVVSDNPIIGKSLVDPLPPEDKSRQKASKKALRNLILRIAAKT